MPADWCPFTKLIALLGQESTHSPQLLQREISIYGGSS